MTITARPYQRFHLIKLLQIPPNEEGRYVCAGRFVGICTELGMIMSNFTRVLNTINSAPHKYWRVGTKLGGVDSRWEIMKKESSVAVGWDKIGDLSNIGYKREDKEKLRTEIAEKYQDSPQQVGRSTQQLFNFVAAIEEGRFDYPI
jgi:5-methylcytosine-specific restriction enzyme B